MAVEYCLIIICSCLITTLFINSNSNYPSPSGEARWGLKTIRLSNSLSLPMGKVRMGYHTGEVRWGLMTIFRLVSIALELSLNFISFVVYPGFCLKIISRCNWLRKRECPGTPFSFVVCSARALSNGCKSRVSLNSGNYIAKGKGVHREVES